MINLLQEITSSTQGFEIFEERTSPTSTWKSLKIRGVFQRADARNQNGRVYPHRVLAQAIKEATESLVSKRMFGELDHPCLTDSNFNVLTDSGWRPFLSISVGDKVWSLQDGRAVLSTVTHVVNQPYVGDVYTIKTRNMHSTFTAPHKLLFSNRAGTGEFKATVEYVSKNKEKFAHSPVPKTAQFTRERTETFTIPATSAKYNTNVDQSKDLQIDAKIFAAFMGIYLAEGSVKTDSYHIFISQKNGWTREYIKEEILDKLSPEIIWNEYPNGFGANDARLNAYLRPLGNKYTKYIPNDVKQLDIECLKELIFWFGIGDGRLVGPKKSTDSISVKQTLAKSIRGTLKSKYAKFQLFSVSDRLITDLHECLVYCGESGNRTVVTTTKDYMYAGRLVAAENKVPLHVLTISTAKNLYINKHVSMEKSHYAGNIFCLTTEHGNFYMEQNGKAFWTGNCDQSPTVSLKNVSHVVTNLKFAGNDVIGEAVVFDDPGPSGTPAGRLLGALIRNNCTVGISSRGYGSVAKNYEGDVVEEYKLVTFDCVHDPSTHNAYIQAVNEGIDYKSEVKKAIRRKEAIDFLLSEFSKLP